MSFVVGGRTATFVTLLLICVCAYVLTKITTAGKWLPTVRKIGGLEALQEMVGRATEMGKPIHFTTGHGLTTLNSSEGPNILAGVAVLGHMAEMCAKYGARLILTTGQADTIPIFHDTLRQAYLAQGKPSGYTPGMVQFIANDQMAYSAGVQAIIAREQVAGNVIIGPLWGEIVPICETAASVGAIQIGGDGRILNTYALAVICDFILIGEEVLTAGAYVTRDAYQLGTIAAQDVCKAVLSAVLLIGVILTALGIPALDNLLKL